MLSSFLFHRRGDPAGLSRLFADPCLRAQKQQGPIGGRPHCDGRSYHGRRVSGRPGLSPSVGHSPHSPGREGPLPPPAASRLRPAALLKSDRGPERPFTESWEEAGNIPGHLSSAALGVVPDAAAGTGRLRGARV